MSEETPEKSTKEKLEISLEEIQEESISKKNCRRNSEEIFECTSLKVVGRITESTLAGINDCIFKGIPLGIFERISGGKH